MGNTANATYQIPVQLVIPGLGVSIVNDVGADYRSDPSTFPTLGMWLNLFTFTGLPVGDFMVMTPLTTITGTLWNGLAGGLGVPELLPLNNASAFARFFVEQNTPASGPIPLAYYENGTTFISQSEIPEPATAPLLVAALAIVVSIARKRLV